ncbi:hypothetical protein TIFTF001_013122 [Ficus carica]|uniref:Uncharacterized protein n=1 Tax=Ficus carica TaxID=3494 RepID=A0AA87ZX42_FICCA|nr:hypothetical protein TIFTF001_013122 [Ficus carica]
MAISQVGGSTWEGDFTGEGEGGRSSSGDFTLEAQGGGNFAVQRGRGGFRSEGWGDFEGVGGGSSCRMAISRWGPEAGAISPSSKGGGGGGGGWVR